MTKSNEYGKALSERYGEVIGGKDLHKVLGFRTSRAFARAVEHSLVGVPVFNIPGRRGKFAMTVDVAQWLSDLRSMTGSSNGTTKPSKEISMKAP